MAPPLGRPARPGRRSPRRLGLAALAALWLIGGLIGAWHYVNAYYQYRGFAAPKDPRGVPAGRVLHQSFYSAALRRQASYLVYLPPGYDLPSMRRRRFPSLYLLHGSPGYPESFLKIAGLGVSLDVLVRARQVAPMLLVMPDGRIGGDTFSDSEWTNGGRGRFGDLVGEVVADVDRRLRSEPRRTARVLAGYSEGGFGAVNLALHDLRTFAGIEAWSGYYVQGRFGTLATASPAVVSANSPLDYAASLGRQIARNPVRAFLYTGRLDPVAPQMVALGDELRAAGARAQAAIYPGAHDWALWRAHAADMLRTADRDFKSPPTVAGRVSRQAARRALVNGLAVAAQSRRSERRAAIIHDRQLADCRISVTLAIRGATDELARMSARGRGVVHYHLVRACLTAMPGRPVILLLCARLPDAIAIERRSARLRRQSITARCLRTAPAGKRRG